MVSGTEFTARLALYCRQSSTDNFSWIMSEDSHVHNAQNSIANEGEAKDEGAIDKIESIASPLEDSVAIGSRGSLGLSSGHNGSTESSSEQQMKGAPVGTPSLKIFVYNLRDFDNRKDFKKLLTKHKIKFKNCQKRRAKHIRYGFVTFDDDASMKDALIQIPQIRIQREKFGCQ